MPRTWLSILTVLISEKLRKKERRLTVDGTYIFGFCLIVAGLVFIIFYGIEKLIDFANDASLD